MSDVKAKVDECYKDVACVSNEYALRMVITDLERFEREVLSRVHEDTFTSLRVQVDLYKRATIRRWQEVTGREWKI